MSSATVEEFEARTEFTDGFAANLWTDLPRDGQGGPTIDFRDIDMMDLVWDIRPTEPGEAEGIVSTGMD